MRLSAIAFAAGRSVPNMITTPNSSTSANNAAFLQDVVSGLTSSPKRLPSKYFYDATGDLLFSRIMTLPEYYLTGCEHEILSDNAVEISKKIPHRFDLLELGAGDGFKTRALLNAFLRNHSDFEYQPVDISKSAVTKLAASLASEFPNLAISPFNGEYLEALSRPKDPDVPRLILLLGANIGNYTTDEAVQFLSLLSNSCSSKDRLLIGFDLRKDPRTILAAYNDSQGVTRDFNLNLLSRINRELNADIDLKQFYHFPVYDPVSGAAKSFLVSKTRQVVTIGASQTQVIFNEGEPIQTEISQKYSIEEISELAHASGFTIESCYTDSKNFFVDSLWKLK